MPAVGRSIDGLGLPRFTRQGFNAEIAKSAEVAEKGFERASREAPFSYSAGSAFTAISALILVCHARSPAAVVANQPIGSERKSHCHGGVSPSGWATERCLLSRTVLKREAPGGRLWPNRV